MLIFIGHNHLLNNFLDVSVCRLHCPIHLGPVGHAVVVLDFKVLAHFPHHLVVPIGGIVRDNLSQQFVLADYLLFNKPDDHLPRDTGVRGSFNLFGEIVDCYQDKTMPV